MQTHTHFNWNTLANKSSEIYIGNAFAFLYKLSHTLSGHGILTIYSFIPSLSLYLYLFLILTACVWLNVGIICIEMFYCIESIACCHTFSKYNCGIVLHLLLFVVIIVAVVFVYGYGSIQYNINIMKSMKWNSIAAIQFNF